MNTNIITRQIGIGMLALCATFVQTTMFATSRFGGSASTPLLHASDAHIANSAHTVTTDAASRA